MAEPSLANHKLGKVWWVRFSLLCIHIGAPAVCISSLAELRKGRECWVSCLCARALTWLNTHRWEQTCRIFHTLNAVLLQILHKLEQFGARTTNEMEWGVQKFSVAREGWQLLTLSYYTVGHIDGGAWACACVCGWRDNPRKIIAPGPIHHLVTLLSTLNYFLTSQCEHIFTTCPEL